MKIFNDLFKLNSNNNYEIQDNNKLISINLYLIKNKFNLYLQKNFKSIFLFEL